MGGIFKENEQINKESVFRTGTRKDLSKGMQLDDNVQPVSRSKSSRDLLRNAPVNEKKNESAEDIIGPEQAVSNEEYLERILQNSAAKNLALRVRQERELQQDAWVNVPDEKTYQFHQQYPSAKKDKLFGSSETRKINQMKRIFRNADLNTAREMPALQDFLAKDEYKAGPVGGEAKDEIFDKKLKHYVNDLVNRPINSGSLTEDYLSNHIAEVYEYSWKLSKYKELKAQYPAFFSSIPETKKITLERMAQSADALKELIDKHLELHGIVIRKDKNGADIAKLRREDENQAVRHRKRRELKEEYDRKYNEFMQTAFVDMEYNLAKQFAENEFVNESEDLLNTLNEQFKEGTEVSELFGDQVKDAIEEIRHTLAVRDELVEEQRGNLARKEQGGAGAADVKRAIRHTNDKLFLCSKHIDNYKQYLYFLKGNIEKLPKETEDFLVREKKGELLDAATFKARIADEKKREQDGGHDEMPEEKIVIKTEKLQSDAAFLSGFGKSFSGKKAANAVKALNEANGRALASAQTACNEKTIAAVQNILIKNRNRAGEEGFACLSAFFKNQEKEDNLLVEKYADKDSRFELLDNLSQECTQTGEVPDFYSDESIVRNAEALDELSRKARSMKALLKANPEYEESPRSAGVRKWLEGALCVSDYFRAKRLLLTNKYYMEHAKKDMASSAKEDDTNAKKNAATLIKLVAECLRPLKSGEYGKRSADIEDRLTRYERQKGAERVLDLSAIASKLDVFSEGMDLLRGENGSNLTEPSADEERIRKYGGASFNMVQPKAEALELAKKSDGFVAVEKVEGRDDVLRLVPSLPETVTLSEIKNRAGEITQPAKTIPLRKYWNMFMKGVVSSMIDENGNPNTGEFDENGNYKEDSGSLSELFVMLGYNINPEENMGKLLDVYVIPKLLSTGISKEDTEAFRDGFLAFARKTKFQLWNAGDTQPHSDLYRISNLSGDPKSTKEKLIKTLKKGITALSYDKKLSPEEQDRLAGETADSLMEDVRTAKERLMEIRNLDINSVSVPVINACSGNAMFNNVIKDNLNIGKKPERSTRYVSSHYWDENAAGKLEKLLADVDELAAAQKKSSLQSFKGLKPEDKEELHRILVKLKADEELTDQDKSNLIALTSPFMTYDYHDMAGHYDGGNIMLTTEAFAADATQYVVETFSMHGAVGIYKNEPGKQEGAIGYYNATEDVPQGDIQRLKIWFKVANNGKLQ